MQAGASRAQPSPGTCVPYRAASLGASPGLGLPFLGERGSAEPLYPRQDGPERSLICRSCLRARCLAARAAGSCSHLPWGICTRPDTAPWPGWLRAASAEPGAACCSASKSQRFWASLFCSATKWLGEKHRFPVPSGIPAGSVVPGESVAPCAPTALAGAPCRSARPCLCPPRGHICEAARTSADPRTPLVFLRRAAAVLGDLLRLQPSPVPAPLSGGSLLYLLMRPRARMGLSLSHVPGHRCTAPDTVPSPWKAAGGGKGCFFLPSTGSLSRPLRTPCKLIRAAQWYSVLIHIEFTFHKLLNCSCF